MKEIKDNFSAGSSAYAAFRPESPAQLYDFLYSQLQTFDTAWDVGTGNGQVAAVLSERFKNVYATDISANQLAKAIGRPNITYAEERAENSSLPDNSVGLVTVAQAFHWFDFNAFFKEVQRVALPGALLAIWTYNLLRIDGGELDDIINDFYFNTVGPYWDPERKYVDTGYKNIAVPFPELETPVFHIRKEWGIRQFLGYIGTWSSASHYRKKENSDPVSLLESRLAGHWADGEVKNIDFPVFMRLFRVE